MGSFKRALLGYRRADVDAALAARDTQISELQRQLAAAADVERELADLSGMVIDREREIRTLREELTRAGERYERSVASLDVLAARLADVQAQARGQATRIRMKALHEAVDITRRAQELAGSVESQVTAANGAAPTPEAAAAAGGAAANGDAAVENGSGPAAEAPPDIAAEVNALFQGRVKVEIGPLDDFSQLVGFEDAAGQIGATSEISVERFSDGRATLSMHIDEPIDLLRELEERSPLEFRVRHTADDNVVLDIDDDGESGQQAA